MTKWLSLSLSIHWLILQHYSSSPFCWWERRQTGCVEMALQDGWSSGKLQGGRMGIQPQRALVLNHLGTIELVRKKTILGFREGETSLERAIAAEKVSDCLRGGVCVCVCVCVLSCVLPSATPWGIARQPPLSMGFSRQEYWSGLPFPSPGDLPDSGIKP